MGRVLLHDDDALLERVFLVDLLLELGLDELVGEPGVLLCGDAHRRVLEHRDAPGQVRDDLCRDLALVGDARRQLARVELDVLDVRLELGPELLQVLDDAQLDRLGQVGVVVRDQARLLPLSSSQPMSVRFSG